MLDRRFDKPRPMKPCAPSGNVNPCDEVVRGRLHNEFKRYVYRQERPAERTHLEAEPPRRQRRRREDRAHDGAARGAGDHDRETRHHAQRQHHDVPTPHADH